MNLLLQIVVSFTVQRVLVVIFPFGNKFMSKKSAWISVVIILLASLIVNSWIPFAFEIQSEEYSNKYCEIKEEWQTEYYILMIAYIFIILIVPISIVFCGNFLIIIKTKKANLIRKNYLKISPLKSPKNPNAFKPELIYRQKHCTRRNALTIDKFNFRFRLFFSNPKAVKDNKRMNTSKNLPRILVAISFCYALLNLPYLIAWLLFYNGTNKFIVFYRKKLT